MAQTRWTDGFLDEMRLRCDPPADEIIQELFDRDEVGAVSRLMRTLVHNDGLPPHDLPERVRDYLDRTDTLPQWADPEQIRRGEELFGAHGPAIVLALLCASLPACYAARKGVQVLHLTAKMHSDPKRRIGETCQMTINVMAAGGLSPTGRGVRDAQKVRLMHAAIRHLTIASHAWDATWGQPINQEDLAGTLLAFSVTVLEALEKLEVTVSAEDAEAYLHAWNAVGDILGIDRRMLPETMDEGRQLLEAIWRRQWEPCAEGREMTRALVQLLEHITPGTVFDGLPSYLIRFLSGDELGDLLGVAHPHRTSMFAGWLRHFPSGEKVPTDHSQVVRVVSSAFSRSLLEGLGWMARGGHRAPFSIPAELAGRWNIRGVADVQP